MATRKKRGRKKTSRKTTRKSDSVKTELGHVIKVLQTIKKHC